MRGSHCSISAAREPDSVSAPEAFASARRNSPVASSSQVRGSVSTTLGGVPRVCRGPATHCTATNGGIRTSTLAPGASAARVRAASRTAVAKVSRSGAGQVSSRSQSATASTTCRVFAGSALSRAAIPLGSQNHGASSSGDAATVQGHRPGDTDGDGPDRYWPGFAFPRTRYDAGATERLRTGFCRSLNRLPCKQCGPTGTM